MKRVQTMVQLSEELLAELDAESAARGDSRSSIIREAVTQYLAGSRRSWLDDQIVEGYRRRPQGAVDDWGDLDAEAATATSETLRRLAIEEGGVSDASW